MSSIKNLEEINVAIKLSEEITMLAASLCEDVVDSKNMSDAMRKIDNFYKDINALRSSYAMLDDKI